MHSGADTSTTSIKIEFDVDGFCASGEEETNCPESKHHVSILHFLTILLVCDRWMAGSTLPKYNDKSKTPLISVPLNSHQCISLSQKLLSVE